MNILITDDEPLARARMRRLLEDEPDYCVVAEASTGREALSKCAESNPDVILLDIRMPDMDGLETALHLSNLDNPPAIIFTTAFSEHALAAFEREAVDYLLKPIRKDRLEKALKKAKKINRAQLQALGNSTSGENEPYRSHISAQSGGNIQLIPVDEIYYFQAEQKYVTVRHLHGEVLIDESLKSLEQEFEQRMIRIHRNALIASKYMEALSKNANGQWQIGFRGIGDKLEVSRRHVSQLRKIMKGAKS